MARSRDHRHHVLTPEVNPVGRRQPVLGSSVFAATTKPPLRARRRSSRVAAWPSRKQTDMADPGRSEGRERQ